MAKKAEAAKGRLYIGGVPFRWEPIKRKVKRAKKKVEQHWGWLIVLLLLGVVGFIIVFFVSKVEAKKRVRITNYDIPSYFPHDAHYVAFGATVLNETDENVTVDVYACLSQTIVNWSYCRSDYATIRPGEQKAFGIELYLRKEGKFVPGPATASIIVYDQKTNEELDRRTKEVELA